MRSDFEQKGDEPTILSIWDTVTLIERKYGTDWKNDDNYVGIVVVASRGYKDEHIQEELPEIWPLCLEFREKGTIKSKKLNPDFSLLAWAIFED